MRRAKKLYAELVSEGWKPGQDVRATQTFESLSEACGCDTEGHSIAGAKSDLHIGEDANGYSIRDLFENLVVNRSNGEPVGSRFVQDYCDPRHQRSMMETGGAMSAVDYSAFAGITGQLMVTQVLAPFQKEEYVASRLVPTYSSPLEQERWIGLGAPKDPTDDITLLSEQEPIRYVGFGENYVETPLTRKRGLGIALTKEALFFDRTGQLTERARQVGDLLALQKEKELLGVMIGGTAHPVYFVEKRQWDSAKVTLDLFQRASATSGAYQLSYSYTSRPYPFVNEVQDNPLSDYTAIRTADQYFSATVDPNTGEPVVVGKPFIMAPHTKRIDIIQILQASNVLKMTAGGLSTTGGLGTVGPNVLTTLGLTLDQVATSRQLKAQLVAQFSNLTSAEADTIWFYGDPTEAFKWVENWPITVVQAPVNSEAEFSQDIVLRWKATMRGRAAIANPRVWQRHNFYQSGSGVDAS